jgi:hypothetical protein
LPCDFYRCFACLENEIERKHEEKNDR